MTTIYQKNRERMGQIKTIVASLGFTETTLQKTESSSGNYFNDYTPTKGVESDIIKIFKTNSKLDRSFAIAFYFKDLEHPYIMVTTKIGNQKSADKITGAKFSPEKFKEKSKSFIDILSTLKKTKKLDEESVFAVVQAHFLQGNEINLDQEIAESLVRVQAEVQRFRLANKDLIQSHAKLTTALNKSKIVVKKGVDSLIKELGILELQKKLEIAKDLVEKERLRLEKQEKIKSLSSDLNHMRFNLLAVKSFVESYIKKELDLMPKSHREKARLVLSQEKDQIG